MSEIRKWSWTEFVLGFLNKNFLVWGMSTAIVAFILFKKTDIDSVFYWIMGGGWLLLSVIFMLAKHIGTAVENAKISLELKAAAEAKVNTDTAKVIEVISGKKPETENK